MATELLGPALLQVPTRRSVQDIILERSKALATSKSEQTARCYLERQERPWWYLIRTGFCREALGLYEGGRSPEKLAEGPMFRENPGRRKLLGVWGGATQIAYNVF